jgi:hypothetical protein
MRPRRSAKRSRGRHARETIDGVAECAETSFNVKNGKEIALPQTQQTQQTRQTRHVKSWLWFSMR